MTKIVGEPGLDLDRVERIAAALAGALSARRIYESAHTRVKASNAAFLSALRSYLDHVGRPGLRLVVSAGLLAHEGVPLGSGQGAITQIGKLLEERECGGIVFSRALADAPLTALLDWLNERTPRALVRPIDGIEILPPGADEGDGEEEAARKHRILPEFQLPDRIQHTAARVLDHVLDDVRAGRRLDLGEIVELTRWTAEASFSLGSQLLAPTQTQSHDSYTFLHSVNVFLIATTLLQPFARDRKELARFSQAALLHDVGKSLIPAEILHKKGRLTPEEYATVKRHPEYGAEILQRCPHVDPIAIEVAFCHHMRENGLGYPLVTLPVKPGPITGIVQVADMFEALTSRRPYHGGHSTVEAVRTILETPGLAGRRPQILLLLERLTQAPPGSEVRLSSGERAVVIKTHAAAPSHPIVRVVESPEGTPLAQSYDIDLREVAPPYGMPVTEVYLKPGLVRTARESSLLV